MEHDTVSAIDSTGYDLLAYYGTGLASQGFKAYIGGGLFKDTWEAIGFNKSFSGLQLGGGLGYNWDSISLELVLNIRDSSDYEDFVNNIPPPTSFTATAVSGSMLLSYRL